MPRQLLKVPAPAVVWTATQIFGTREVSEKVHTLKTGAELLLRNRTDNPATRTFGPISFMHLLLGGARSGKSSRAVTLCHEASLLSARKKVFIATAQAFDDEMKYRIGLHQNERDASWGLVEAPLDLAGAIYRLAGDEIVLIDCLTLWLSNVILAEADVDAHCAGLVTALSTSQASLFIVSNEVGMGLVPETALGRRFRDAQGRLNQHVAAVATVVEFVVAGLPLRLKG